MGTKPVRDLMLMVKMDPKAKEVLSDLPLPGDEEGAFRYYVEAAKRLNFDTTEAEIREAVQKSYQEQQKRTDAAAGVIEKIPDDDLERIAGGKSDRCVDIWYDPCHRQQWEEDCDNQTKCTHSAFG